MLKEIEKNLILEFSMVLALKLVKKNAWQTKAVSSI